MVGILVDRTHNTIAVDAKVPLALGMMDYRRKVVGLGPAIMPTGYHDADLVKLAKFYNACTPKFPERAPRL